MGVVPKDALETPVLKEIHIKEWSILHELFRYVERADHHLFSQRLNCPIIRIAIADYAKGIVGRKDRCSDYIHGRDEQGLYILVGFKRFQSNGSSFDTFYSIRMRPV